jgi:16S rRNA (adenine1518-N6/adenine1519-N6)-dimethyltransferase
VIRARKRFGQHFLEPAWVDKVVRAIAPQPDETFLEIGPGHGALTRPLAARANAVIAYEVDRDLAAELQETAPQNVTVIEGDFLTLGTDDSGVPTGDSGPRKGDWTLKTAGRLRAAGNLPYNVASPIMFKLAQLFAAGLPIADATVMLQREVADRLIAKPGTREYGVLSALLQHVADVEMTLKLPAGAFRPAPKVLSALARLRFHAPDPPVVDPAVFAAIVQAVFTRRRKTLSNALLAYRDPSPIQYGGRVSVPAPAQALADAGLDGRRRPGTVTVAEFARLADAYAAKRSAVL